MVTTLNTSGRNKTIASLVEVVESEEEDVVATFAPVIPSAVLSNGTDSGDSDNVSNVAPLKCRHFVWRCFVDGPLIEFPVRISSLVDNGCHLVLICSDIVEKLGLKIFALPHPEPIDIAIKDSEKKKKLELENFVLLSATSLDQTWTSYCVCTLIAPNLCMPIIFGLPFLSHEHIAIDHAAHSCIDEKSGYNLLNLIIVTPPPKKLQPKEKRHLITCFKKETMEELTNLCKKRKPLVDASLEPMKGINIVSAV